MNASVLDQFLAISSLFQKDLRRSFTGTSLTEPRVHLLWVLFHTGPSPQHLLAKALGTSPRSISALVDGLAATGYVSRQPDPNDRRAVFVTLSDEAIRMMRRMQDDHTRLSKRLIDAVSPEDREAFKRGTSAVLSRLDELVSGEQMTYRDVESMDT